MRGRFGIEMDTQTFNALFKMFDMNGDNSITLKEFVKYFERAAWVNVTPTSTARSVVTHRTSGAEDKYQKFRWV